MILLIVDDEPDVLDGILTGVDMEKLGFTQVYTARSGEEAMQIMLQNPVDILVTDIEMSDMNGLSLLEWARQNQKNVVTIFCTAYSEFNYAKKAVELHAFDYYLKPIRYEELTHKLISAAEQVRRNAIEGRISSTDLQRQNRYYYWSQIMHKIDGKWSSDSESGCPEKKCWLLSQAQRRSLPYEEKDLFTILIFDLYQEDKLQDWSPSLIDAAFENVLSELFDIPDTSIEAITSVHPGAYQLILFQPDQHPIDRDKVYTACRSFISFCNQHMDISADCYFCTDITLHHMSEILCKANDIFRDDIANQNQIYDIYPYRKKGTEYANPVFSKQVEDLLRQRQWEEIQRIIHTHLMHGTHTGILTRSGLQAMQLDFIQAVNSFLQSNNIPAHTIFFNEEYRSLYENAKDAVDATIKFVDWVLQQTKKSLFDRGGANPEKSSVVEQIQDYISEHLSEDLNRIVLAKIVYLNPDYLAKLFKEKTGQSLAAYVKNQRIERAKILLIETDIPIGSIAQQIGYDNLSYFSSVFHDKVGMQPGEYRRQVRSDENKAR